MLCCSLGTSYTNSDDMLVTHLNSYLSDGAFDVSSLSRPNLAVLCLFYIVLALMRLRWHRPKAVLGH